MRRCRGARCAAVAEGGSRRTRDRNWQQDGYVSGGVSTPAPSREFITTAQRPVGRRFRRGRASRSGASATIAVMASDARSPMSPLTLRPGRMTLAALRDLWAAPRHFAVDPPRARRSMRPRRRSSASLAAGQVVYGVNTGFGLLARTRIDDARLAELQRALVLSHQRRHRARCSTTPSCGSSSRSRPRRSRAAIRACAGR